MAQPSVLNYFNNRKRTALEDNKIDRAKKVLVLDGNGADTKSDIFALKNINNKIITAAPLPKVVTAPATPKLTKKATVAKAKKIKPLSNSVPIDHLLNNIRRSTVSCNTEDEKANIHNTITESPSEGPREFEPPSTPPKSENALDKIKLTGQEPTLAELKFKLSRSSRLAELKASLNRFKESQKGLAAAEKKTISLKNFKELELEVNLSPTKPQSPQKPYLSPVKNSSVRKNLFSVPSPTKNAVVVLTSPSKHVTSVVKDSLALPYKYRRIAEIFRAMDTICQILFNRKETITFKKLKSSSEQILKQNIYERHLAQIKHIFPDSFSFHNEKLREFGTGTRKEQWELVVVPQVAEAIMTPQIVLERRRKLFVILIEKVKDYHDEFLLTLDPPMKVIRKEVKRWHPQFDIEKVPDIECSALPQRPNEELFTTGNQVLENARTLFNCNTRMERALERLKQSQATETTMPETKQESILKGIPKALLEKVRQRQAAKALEAMTRSDDQEKEARLYSQLPEIARLARNLFVSEKRNIMPLDIVLDKLCQSSRVYIAKNDMELYLRTIAKEETEWIKMEVVRNATFVKIQKRYDVSLVLSKLQKLADQKVSF
ncbi:hypothetical protein FQA39_LY04035 [Lamprigera yunnana]|nr:hypothetical protein FQA39_LY04035 [Lamprigera yunnana]